MGYDGKGSREKKRIIESGVTRRIFLAGTGGTIGLTAAAALGLPGLGKAKVEIEFVESSCGKDKKTAWNVLVAYASKCGSTGEVAEAIGKEICEAGAAADVRLLKDVDDLSYYTAVIVGGAIRNFKWLSEASKFVEEHEQALSQLPVAYFMTCLQIVPGQPALSKKGKPPQDESDEQKRKRVLSYLDPVLKNSPQVKPEDIGIFAGALDFAKLKGAEKVMMNSLGFVEGDFRDFEAIKAWAKEIAPRLLK